MADTEPAAEAGPDVVGPDDNGIGLCSFLQSVECRPATILIVHTKEFNKISPRNIKSTPLLLN